MLAILVRLALLAEFALWTALGLWLVERHEWPAVLAVAGVIAGALLVRLALVCASLGLSWIWRSPRTPGERLGLVGTAALIAGEWSAMLANNFLWLPFERMVLRPDPTLWPSPCVPIIVVHGYFCNRGSMRPLVHALDKAGVGPVFVPSLPAIFAPIETFAEYLDKIVREVTKVREQSRAILVCHSMGGLAARAYLKSYGSSRIAALVTLASPHQGTVLVELGVGANARQMLPGSEFLCALNRFEGDSGPDCPVLSVYSVHDNLVAPQDSSRLCWARNIAVHGVAHLAMLSDSRVQRAVLDELAIRGARPRD